MTSRETGNSAEDLVCSFLELSGHLIIKRNYHFGRVGEIDIICSKNGIVIFAEVRYRSKDAFGGALSSVNLKKISRMRKAAAGFIRENPQYEIFRFDLLSVDGHKISHIEDIVR